ncbi:porin [Vibrio sp. WXL103]|uniref:porin n=1 Tax=unclassified Vibrio TaxID=2614977 RepID=UPI003EC57DD8
MNKKILAIAIAATTFGAQAVELYNEDGTTFSMGGHVAVNLNGGADADTTVGSNSPRINFTATQELDNGFTVDARGEWALNFLENSDNSFTTRLGYLGLSHDDLGRAVVGTQWAPYYDVASVTDMPIAYANGFLYDPAGIKFSKTGQTRADQMVSYRNGVELGDAGAIGFGAAWQGATVDSIGQRAQIALTYSVAGAQLGYAYNTGSVDGDDLTFNVVSAKYGSYGAGLYLAGVYQMTEDKRVDIDTDSFEVIAAYALANSLNFSINYENVEADDETTTDVMALNVEYNFAPNVVGFAGYQFDLDESDDNVWTIGSRIYL